MFERMMALAVRHGAALAAARRERLAARLAADVPDGVAVIEEDEAVLLAGQGLKRRIAEDVRLRWIGWEAAQ